MRWRPFAVLLAVLTASLARVAFIESHWDEDAVTATGWLLSKGWKLYSGIFAHHTQLDFIPSTLLAFVFGPSSTAMRAFMLALWTAVAAGLYGALRRREAGARTAALFAVLSSQWLTYWCGQMMLVENYWGYATASALALIGSPLGLEPEPSRRRALVIGALIALILTASLVCLPVAALLALWTAADPAWRKHGRFLALGAAGWLVFFGAWSAATSDLSLMWRNVVTFNSEVYARFFGLKGGAAWSFWRTALEHNAVYFSTAFEWENLERYFDGLIKLSAFGWAAWSFAERKWAQGAWKLAFIIAVHSRPEKAPDSPPSHSAAFYLVATMTAASALARSWGALAGRRRAVFAAAAAAILLPTLWATSLLAASLRPYASRNAAYDELVTLVRRCTAAEDAVSVFPYYPRFYMETGKVPATPNVFYLPWQAAWEPERRATMDALARVRPKVVLIQDTKIWGIPWREYGAEVDAWLDSEGYAPIFEISGASSLKLLVRPDAAAAFAACVEKSR